jgi:ABC-type lipoprotein release transport system permease subunit
MASITFAVMLAISMQSFQKGIFDNLVKNVVQFYYGYMQIHSKGYWDEKVLDNSFEWNDSLSDKIHHVAGIQEVVPRLENFVLASMGNSTKGCMLVGTDFARENTLTHLESKLVKGNYIIDNEVKIIIAEGLANRLNVAVNDTIVLLGQGFQGTMAAGKYPIKGIVHFGSPALNNEILYLPLPEMQSFLNAESRVTSLALLLDNPENMTAVQHSISTMLGGDFEVMTWQEMMPEIADHIKADGRSFKVFTSILYLIIAFGIFGTILMMLVERKYEFGMLIAIGTKKMILGLVLLYETLFITILGILAGIILSFPVVYYFHKYPIHLTGEMENVYESFGFEATFPTALNLDIFILQSIIVLILAIILGLYPLWFIKHLNPLTAMKK